MRAKFHFNAEQRGGVAVMFAYAIVPVMLAIGAAVDYQNDLYQVAMLQTGADELALYVSSVVGQYYRKNRAYPPQGTISGYLTQANAMVASATDGHGSVTSGNYHVCTPTNGDCSIQVNGSTVTLLPGQAAVRATGSQPRMFYQQTTNLAATAIAGTGAVTAPSPATLNYKFQYAKGWYYKVITLWATPANSSTPTALAKWTYQATNLNQVADPANPPPYFPTNPTDLGIGTVTTWYAPTTVVDSSGTITLSPYSNIYLTMQVADQQCAPGQTYNAVSQTATNSYLSFYSQYYWGYSNTTTTVGCSGTANTNFDLTMSTNSATNSNYIWINGVEQPANQVTPLTTAFPCPTNPAAGQTATNYYEWEDSDNVGVGSDRDYFFSLTTTCSVGNWTNAATTATPVLVR